MGMTEVVKEVNFGTPVYKITLKMRVRRELFQVNSFGYGMDELERYGVASRIARNLVGVPVWHYTDRGNLVCGDGKNTETLPIREFTIVVDDNLDFLIEKMCLCGSDRLAAYKLFAVGVTIAGLGPGEEKKSGEREAAQHTSFSVILGKIRD